MLWASRRRIVKDGETGEPTCNGWLRPRQLGLKRREGDGPSSLPLGESGAVRALSRGSQRESKSSSLRLPALVDCFRTAAIGDRVSR